jgi:nicotinate-nucleotide adenylyltransferase
MKRLYFGGSFNPIHHAHLICARSAAEARGFDRVVLVPSAQPPHKPDALDMASPQDRLAMCRLAIAGQGALFEVDELELQRVGPSFTIDTVRWLKRHGQDEVQWLIGADMLAMLPQWHESEQLLRETRFLVLQRPGQIIDWHGLPPAVAALRQALVPAPLLQISGTEIRQRCAAGRSIAYLTPPAVMDYIHDRRLYQS